MIATLVYIQVKPEFLASFIEVTRVNHENSIKESGNLCFDILQDAADPSDLYFMKPTNRKSTQKHIKRQCTMRNGATRYPLGWPNRVKE